MVSLAAEVEDTCAKEDKQMNKIEEKMDKVHFTYLCKS